ncbi:hypothetical protein DFH08DRAFT_939034 [Mycena albidolilacea]|uniref:Uncharacterized protein n=1 Tax=Mycena albidolilacea TaxID=1033008 RepID=A0AAD6ZSZ2_9AGAR|nr:hypothetical protein DFH08DRAFT_939034 [Mycena albidolilacea]
MTSLCLPMPLMSCVAPQSTEVSTRPVASVPALELPRTLERPPYSPSSDSNAHLALAAADPANAHLPLPFIQDQLARHSAQLLAGLRALPIPRTIRGPLDDDTPDTIETTVPNDDSSVIYPTHVLVASASVPPASEGPAPDLDAPLPLVLVSIHGLVLAAHCAAAVRILPSAPAPVPGADSNSNAISGSNSDSRTLPPDSDGLTSIADTILVPDPDDGTDTDAHTLTLTLPICPVPSVLPSLEALLALRTWMYTKSLSALFAAFFPGLPLDDSETQILTLKDASSELIAHLSARLLSSSPNSDPAPSPSHLLHSAARVRDIWLTARALEVYRTAEVWDALDLAWEVVLLALSIWAEENTMCGNGIGNGIGGAPAAGDDMHVVHSDSAGS